MLAECLWRGDQEDEVERVPCSSWRTCGDCPKVQWCSWGIFFVVWVFLVCF